VRAEALGADRYPLTWVQCDRCCLVQVLEDVDDRLLFSNYNYASSTVAGLVRHFDAYANALVARHGVTGTKLLEIGCNDGVLLRRLPRSWSLVGVDPSDVAMSAPDRPYELVSRGFSSSLALELGAGSFDIVTGSNCLAHISDLSDVFRGVAHLLRTGGEFWVEVHDLASTLAGGQWDTIYHEHKAEWSEVALARCLAPLGFELILAQRLPLHGGLLRLAFRKVGASVVPPQKHRDDEFDMIRQSYQRRRETATYRALRDALERGERVSAYGASGRANVWLNQLPELGLEYIVDDSPLRADKWLPCVAMPVVRVEHFAAQPPAFCVVTAWNYAADIQSRYPEFEGVWLQSFGSGTA
jgi:SAM-dependent methyltransferase